MLDQLVTLLTAAEKAVKLYDWATGVFSGETKSRLLAAAGSAVPAPERLTEHVLYIPTLQEVVSSSGAAQLADRRKVAELMDPVARSLRTEVLSTAVTSTPSKLREALAGNPWKVLLDARPAQFAVVPIDPDLVPVYFALEGMPFIGWQKRTTLELMFDLQLRNSAQVFTQTRGIVVPNEYVDHLWNRKGICDRCGCSREAVSRFRWKCYQRVKR